jgi:hypothetical protein
VSHVKSVVPADLEAQAKDVTSSVQNFATRCEPLERDHLYLLIDARTLARYCECHIKADKLVANGTIDVPLDPEEQPEYRANREIVEDHVAFERMKEDAGARRTFSNIVAEFSLVFDENHPIKIIGGQHRFTAIEEALANGTNEYHGVKVYFDLDPDQRLDLQLISNTNIAVSTDLFDRMQETLAGPELRIWCQAVGLLEKGQDFADKRDRSRPVTVRAARTFILNYFLGREVDSEAFEHTDTTPVICKTGVLDIEWEKIKDHHKGMWRDSKLHAAGRAFAQLIEAQRKAFAPDNAKGKRKASNIDYAEKALNFAVLSSWAYTAGMLNANPVRLERHFALKDQTGKDPLNAAALARGRHKSDPENYRGLGYRTDAKERGRFVELFYLQSEKGDGISPALVDLAIKKYHAKLAASDVRQAEEKA